MKLAYLAIFAALSVIFCAIEIHGKDEEVKTPPKNAVRAKGTCGADLDWDLNNEGTLTISGIGYMENFSYRGSPWYSYRSSITKVVIGEGVKSIGNQAFYDCNCTNDVKIPDSLELIGESAFGYCSAMKNVNVGNGVKTIMDYAFTYCGGLVNVTIGSGLVSMGIQVFYQCSSLTSIEVDENNTFFSDIDGVMFSDNSTVLVKYPVGKAGTTYIVPDHVEKIENYAFFQSSLTSVIFPDGVTSIGNYAFYNSIYLVNITLPDTVTTIGAYAFSSCLSLVILKLSNRLEVIDKNAFHDCRKLGSISIPGPVKDIGNMALCTCSSYMESIVVEDGNEYFKSVNGVLFNYNITELVQYPPGKTDVINYAIPDSVMIISAGAFESSQLVNVVIPSGVQQLNNFVFRRCYKLTCVNIPEGVTSVGSQTFYECTSLGNVTIPDTMNSISGNAFDGCSNLKSVFYQGYTPISSTALVSLASLTDVCTPPGYVTDTFCGATVTPSSETCQTYQSFFGQCGRGSCVDGVLVEEKWDNVTKWEQQTNECEVYQCDAVNGFISWWNCNTSDEMSRVCVKGQCIEKDTTNEGWTVEVEMNNVTLNEVNETNVIYILSNYSGISNMKIGMEVDDKGNVILILIYVQDETSAKIIAKAVKEMKEGEDNLFRKTINVRVTCRNAFLSNGDQSMINFLLSLAPLLITLMTTN